MNDPQWNAPHLPITSEAAKKVFNKLTVTLHSPTWEAEYNRAVEAANVTLTDPALVAEAAEIGRLRETQEGRRVLADRLAAKALRTASAAAKKVNHMRDGRCVPAPDHKTVLAALEFVADLSGCKAPTQIELNDLSKLSDEDLEKRYRALLAKAAEESK